VATPTGPVFRAWDGVDRGPLGHDWWHGRNDLEAPAALLQPVIGEVLEWLRGLPGAVVVRMSGSGATCFGLFGSCGESAEAARAIRSAYPHWWVKATILR
jgi:4-diphosphocytidyl-2-C-methyl-D-erythritol kinase